METQHEHLESLYPQNSRFPEIEKLLSFVRKGVSCQMIAMPGVGRGNVLKFLAYNRNIRLLHLGEKQTDYHFVYINFDEIKSRPVIDALKFIFLELVSSLHERGQDHAFEMVNNLFKESLSYHDELVLFQGLKDAIDFLTAEIQLHIILLFERFETYLPKLTPDFFNYLRTLRNKAKYKFSVVFSVTRPLEETVESVILADFFEFFTGHDVFLDLTDTPGILFRIHYLEQLTTQQFDKKSLEQLLTLTGGHGKLTRLSAELILGRNTTHKKDSLTPDFLLSQKTIQNALKEIWDFLSPSEQDALLALSQKKSPGEVHQFPQQIHLLSGNNITIPLFQSYLHQYAQSLKSQQEPILYDVATNTIKKGTTILSDKLTASEFRLLRYLIEHPLIVLGREEIINAVWKDSASTLGVTDQALDQLIFRVRKKIEEDIANPVHIQTVKGRGIQFQS